MSKYKEYLGDGVYLDFDGFHIILTTEDGVSVTNTIFLEPEFPEQIVQYKANLLEKIYNEQVKEKKS